MKEYLDRDNALKMELLKEIYKIAADVREAKSLSGLNGERLELLGSRLTEIKQIVSKLETAPEEDDLGPREAQVEEKKLELHALELTSKTKKEDRNFYLAIGSGLLMALSQIIEHC